MTVPQRQESRTPEDILMDLLDLANVVDRTQPAHRYVSTERLREVITHGWNQT